MSFDDDFPDYVRKPSKASGTNDSTSGEVSGFDQAFPDYVRGATLGKEANPVGNGNLDFNYSDIPVPQNLKQQDIAPLGAGLVRGAKDVPQSIGNLELGLANKLGLINPEDANFVKNSQANRENAYGQEFANNKLAGLGRGAGQFITSMPLMMAGGELVGAGIGAVPGIEAASAALQGNKLLSPIANIAENATKGYAQGAAANTLIGQDANEGGKFGAAVNTVLPLAGKAISNVAGLFKGQSVDPAISEMAKLAQDKYGITLPNAQISNSNFVKWLDSVLPSVPFSGHGNELANAKSQFTKAVSNTFGADSPALTRDVMDNAHSALSNKFNDIASRTPNIDLDGNLINKLANIHSDAAEVLGKDAAPVTNQIDKILNLSKDGKLSGDSWNALMRTNTPLDRLAKSTDPNTSYYARNIKDALYDGLQSSAPADLVNDMATAKAQWKNYKTIEDLANKSGVTGEISPALLLSQTNKTARRYGTGGLEDLQNLSDIGQYMKGMPLSGTAERNRAFAGVGGVGSIGTALAAGNLPLAAQLGATAASTSLGSRALSKAINSNTYRNMLLNPSNEPFIEPEVVDFLGRNYIPSSVIMKNNLSGNRQ